MQCPGSAFYNKLHISLQYILSCQATVWRAQLLTLIYVTSKRVQVLSSSEGVHQGDPLGPALFSATIHPVLCEVLTRHDEVTIFAYWDDVYVVGPTENLKLILEDLKSSLLIDL